MHIQSHFSVDHRHHEQRVWMTFRKPVAMRLVVQGLDLESTGSVRSQDGAVSFFPVVSFV